MLAIISGVLVTILILLISKEQLKNSNNVKSFLFIFFIFAITTIFLYFILINVPLLKKFVSINNLNTYDNIVLMLFSMSISILINGLLGPITQKIYETYLINKYEKKYQFEKYEYYRDIIYSKSPAILSYCYNKKINVEDVIVAILLNLKMKKLITIEQNQINIIGNINNISKHEKYLIDNIPLIYSDNKTFNANFKRQIVLDLKRKKYAQPITSENANILYFMEYFMLWMIIHLIVSLPIFFALSNIPILDFLAYFLVFVGIPIYKSLYEKINPIHRTQKALELSGKLLGLKNYIYDFSYIKDNSIDNINLYEEYVIYAIIFNLKGKLNNECKQIYKNIEDSLNFPS